MKNTLVKIGVKSKKDTKVCVTNLDKWLAKKNLRFEEVNYANFGEVMLATVEFDKDNTIYIILPKAVFK